jgi:hypothetical protein
MEVLRGNWNVGELSDERRCKSQKEERQRSRKVIERGQRLGDAILTKTSKSSIFVRDQQMSGHFLHSTDFLVRMPSIPFESDLSQSLQYFEILSDLPEILFSHIPLRSFRRPSSLM